MNSSKNQSKEKLLTYLDHFIESDFFQKMVRETREELNIPKKGLNKSKDELTSCSWDKYILYIPEELKGDKGEILRFVNSQMGRAYEKFPVNDIRITAIFTVYIYYNLKIYKILNKTDNICSIEDIKQTIQEREGLKLNSKEINRMIGTDTYPVILKINPSASQRDIVSYIKDNWKIIKYHLDKYENKSKLGKIRSRDPKIKERDRFIYKNREKPYKEIVSLVQKKFPEVSDSIDQGSVGKIISLERQRRKEV
ncbi:MAG: hypothetical protein ACQEP3_00650 [Patescibacteria group bacterium]